MGALGLKKPFPSFKDLRKTSIKPIKTISKPINHSAFERRQLGLSKYVQISKLVFLTKIIIVLQGGEAWVVPNSCSLMIIQ